MTPKYDYAILKLPDLGGKAIREMAFYLITKGIIFKYRSRKMMHKLCADLIAGINIRENLIELNKEIKKDEAFDQFLDIYYEHEDVFKGFMDHEDAKVRKNIIKVMGRVADTELLSLLMSHYEQEETQFLKGDYLEYYYKTTD